MTLRLTIQELTLHGFAPSEKHRIAEAIGAELARLLGSNAVPEGVRQTGAVAQIDGGAIQVSCATPAHAVGAQVAAALFKALQG